MAPRPARAAPPSPGLARSFMAKKRAQPNVGLGTKGAASSSSSGLFGKTSTPSSLAAPPTTAASTSTAAATQPSSRVNTPPPALLGAPTAGTPIGVRHDPDSGKMFLLVSPRAIAKRRREAEREAERLADEKTAAAQADLQDDDEDSYVEEEEDLPMRKRRRGAATLPPSPRKAPPITPLPPADRKSVGAAQREVDLDGEPMVMTPRDVREQATGRRLPSYATPDGPAVFSTPFQGGLAKLGSSFSSSAAGGAKTNDKSDKPLTFGDSPAYELSPSLPMPTHYATLLALHSALEHALIAHLAVTGPGGAMGSPSSPQFGSPKSPSSSRSASKKKERNTERIVRMPALLPFSTLRPLVERAAARRLGHAELARLVALWGGGSETEPKDDGIGLFISRVKALDARGRKGWDWAVGIEVRLSRRRRQATPPLSASFGSLKAVVSPSTPPSLSALTDARAGEAAREGMSVIALWNTGLETRKMAVKSRLLEWLGKAHEAWLDANPSLHAAPASDAVAKAKQTPSRPSTPEPRAVMQGEGGLLTPAATREGAGNKRATRTVVLDNSTLGGSAPPKAVAVISPQANATSGWQRPIAGETLSAWHPLFPLGDAPLPPAAELPSLSSATRQASQAGGGRGAREAVTSAPRPSLADMTSDSQTMLDTSELTLTPGPAPPPRALTLEERIRAKEQARKNGISLLAAKSGVKAGSSSRANAGGDLMASFKRRSTLSRLDSIAEGLYMLFLGSSSSGSSSSASAPGKRSAMLPLPDVLASIAKSSAVALSRAEASEALDLLRELAPGFVSLSNVGGRQWACLEDGAQLKVVREAVKRELRG